MQWLLGCIQELREIFPFLMERERGSPFAFGVDPEIIWGQEALGSLLLKHSCSAQHLPGREHTKAEGFANSPSATHEPLVQQNVCFGVIWHLWKKDVIQS